MSEHYLGDGLYASTEGGMVKLRAPRDIDHIVFIEPEVWHELIRFVRHANKTGELTWPPFET